MDPRIIECQKHRDVLPAFWPRKLSPYLTSLLVKTPITPNQTTVLWGVISVMNSYLIYRTLIGDYFWLLIFPLVYVLVYMLDCVDGEIARFKGMEDPVAGKLLDGVCHRVTEYSLLAAYGAAASTLSSSAWVLPVALLLVSGEAMQAYAYERRLTVMRIHRGFTGLMGSEAHMYLRGERWAELSLRRKITTITGQIHYRSVYVAIALAYLSAAAFLAGLGLLAGYKHISWMRLVARTLDAAKDPTAEKAAV